MKHHLYYYPANANLAPHILLEEAGCEHELVLVDRRHEQQKSAEYLRLNPNGRIQVLVSGELVLFEAAALCRHIADLYPQSRLAPPLGTAERAHSYKWLIFLTNTVQPAYMAFRYPDQYSGEPPAFDGVRRAAIERLRRAFHVLNDALASGPFLLGSAYSACDAYLYMLTWWAERLSPPPSELTNVRRCVRAVAARPAPRLRGGRHRAEIRLSLGSPPARPRAHQDEPAPRPRSCGGSARTRARRVSRRRVTLNMTAFPADRPLRAPAERSRLPLVLASAYTPSVARQRLCSLRKVPLQVHALLPVCGPTRTH